MFTVKKKPLTSNTIWDAENNRPLCKFVKGVFQTNDQAVAEKLKELGYEVTSDGEPDTQETADVPDTPDDNVQPSDGETADGDDGEPDTQETPKTRRSRK